MKDEVALVANCGKVSLYKGTTNFNSAFAQFTSNITKDIHLIDLF